MAAPLAQNYGVASEDEDEDEDEDNFNMTEIQKLEVMAEANRMRHAAELEALRFENQAMRDILYDKFGLFVTTINPTMKMKQKLKTLTVASTFAPAVGGSTTCNGSTAGDQAMAGRKATVDRAPLAISPKPMMGVAVSALAGLAMVAAPLAFSGCSTQQVTTTAYKAEATTDAAVTTAMSAWGGYVATYHPAASEELQVETAFNTYKQAELAAIDATAAYANAAGSNSVAQAQNETTALNAATQSLTDLLNLAAQFEATTNRLAPVLP